MNHNKSTWFRWKKEEEDVVLENYPRLKVSDIQSLLPHFTIKQIFSKIERLQKKGRLCLKKQRLNLDEIDFIKDNYSVMGPKFIGKMLDRDLMTVANKAWQLGLSVLPEYKQLSRMNDDDISEFETVTKPEIAYFLGYFWADGSLEKDTYRLKFVVSEEDFRQVKHKILPLLSSWSYTEFNSKVGTRLSDLRICHRDLYNLLSSLDFEIKSGASANKVLSHIPEHLRHYWWRGYFDGDGCFSFDKNQRTTRVAIAACFEQDWTFVYGAGAIPNIDWRIDRRVKEDGKSSYLITEGQACVQRYCEYIYSGEWIGLQRKRDLYNDWMAFRKSVRPNKTSKHRGVTLVDGRWFMRIYKNKIRRHGWFDSEIDAARAYNEIATELFGNKAVLNHL